MSFRTPIAFILIAFPVLLCLGISPLEAAKKKTTARFQAGIAPLTADEKEMYQLNVTQPYSFRLKTIQQSMASLGYQERVISWSGKKRVFNNEAIKNMAPLILKNFSHADSNQRVVFKVLSPSGRVMTRGDTFLTPQGLHWRFAVMNRSRRKIGGFSVMGDSWRLVLRKGQVYKKKMRRDLNNLVQDVNNWIVFPAIRPIKSRLIKKNMASPPAAHKEKTSPSIKERLRILEELKKENMIDKEEYKSKRREILKEF